MEILQNSTAEKNEENAQYEKLCKRASAKSTNEIDLKLQFCYYNDNTSSGTTSQKSTNPKYITKSEH